MSDHIVRAYDEDLRVLTYRIGEMGGVAEHLVADAVEALVAGNNEQAQAVIEGDKRIDHIHEEIEEKAILLIAKRQPMALDLREIIAALRISHDLERVGDLAKNIAKRALAIEGALQPKRLVLGVQHMVEITLEQLKAVLDAYANHDDAAAIIVRKRDEEVDAMYTSLFRELLTYMMEDPRNITLCTHLLFCAKNLERIGDHATNVAETVHYIITGHKFSGDRARGDETIAALSDVTPGEK
ncbi:MAG TPA: phosphate signaling complex protein PhoU [Hyphomicrobiales bacterium]|nr:phosphate signaling complex protein PhoU [Kaistiaceae bacterium]HQF29893.1 phosphate signaling complex protein PhoU [Hyphomicrobiales bacterium]